MNSLQEVAKLGAEQAATALSTLLGLPVSVNAVKAVRVTLREVGTLGTTSPADVFVGVYFTLHGERPGSSLLLLSRADACRLVDVANRKPVGRTTILDDYAQSTVREIGNILAGAFFAAARNVVPVLLVHSIPRLVIDQCREIVSSLLAPIVREEESMALMECELVVETMNARCHLIIVLSDWTS